MPGADRDPAWPSATTAVVDPIRRQLLFDFDGWSRDGPSAGSEPHPLRKPGINGPRGVQDRFLAAVQAEEAGEKQRAIKLYEEIMELDPGLRAGLHQPGNHPLPSAPVQPGRGALPPRHGGRPGYVLAFFDLGNVLDELQRLDESIAAYRRRSRWLPATPTPTTTWPWPTSARASAARAAPLAGLRPAWTMPAAPGPTTPAARSASC
jgi:tetratricopeptide (TPR) repeat protein